MPATVGVLQFQLGVSSTKTVFCHFLPLLPPNTTMVLPTSDAVWPDRAEGARPVQDGLYLRARKRDNLTLCQPHSLRVMLIGVTALPEVNRGIEHHHVVHNLSLAVDDLLAAESNHEVLLWNVRRGMPGSRDVLAVQRLAPLELLQIEEV